MKDVTKLLDPLDGTASAAPAAPGCRDCRFWIPESRVIEADDEWSRLGACHRHAPRPFLLRWEDGRTLDGYATAEPRWPCTMCDEWCGEFVRRAT